MAFTESEELRIETIETKLNEIQTAINRLATKSQLNSLLSIRQNEIEDLKERVSALETQVLALQSGS